MNKDIFRYSEIRDRIISGLDKLADPIKGTLTPQGKNVIYQDQRGDTYLTNDGFTIAQNITLEDPVENAVVTIARQAALETNRLAGDGTTTSILLAQTLVKEGFKAIDGGESPMELRDKLHDISDLLIKNLDKYKMKVRGEQDLEYVARVSSNNDEEISGNVVHAVIGAGEDGLVFIEGNQNATETEVVEEKGFLMKSGMFSQFLSNQRGKFSAGYEDVPVFITDKRLYYEEECLDILKKVAEMGYNKVVLIARDFIGQAPNLLIANHTNPKVNMSVLLVKDKSVVDGDFSTLDDLATYLGGEVVSEKRGSFVGKLSEKDFIIAEKVYSDHAKTIIVAEKKKNIPLDLRVKALKEALAKEEKKLERENYERRIACLTNGITTIKVGGKTPVETREKIYRYEDAVNATRNAIKSGYVVGGGLTLWNVFKDIEDKLNEGQAVIAMVKSFCLAPLKQIAENCNVHFPTLLSKVKGNVGYNAVSKKYEDLHKAGIIEPYLVLKHSIENSMSVAGVLLSANFMIMNQPENKDEK